MSMPRTAPSSVSARCKPVILEQLEGRVLLAAVPTPDHVLVVVEENRSYFGIIGYSGAPYINSLASQGALFTNSFAVTHPSQPNYLALFSGSTQGVTDDSVPPTFSAANLGSELLEAGRSFVGYSESLPFVGFTGASSGDYWRKHAPWVDFSNIPADLNQPFTSFPSDFSELPTLSFVIPDQANDMHDGSRAQGDTWLHDHIDPYVQWAKTHNSLLVLTWDEDDSSGDNHITTIFAGPMVTQVQYVQPIDHYSVLRTLEEMYALPAAGESANAVPITDVWAATTTPGPTPVIVTRGDPFRGKAVKLTGSAIDADGRALLNPPYTWTVTLNAGGQVFPVPVETRTIKKGIFRALDGHAFAPGDFYSVSLTVTDSQGHVGTTQTLIPVPVKMLNISSNVPGVLVRFDGAPLTTPASIQVTVGSRHTLEALDTQTVNQVDYDFTRWSRGRKNVIVVAVKKKDLAFSAAYTAR